MNLMKNIRLNSRHLRKYGHVHHVYIIDATLLCVSVTVTADTCEQ